MKYKTGGWRDSFFLINKFQTETVAGGVLWKKGVLKNFAIFTGKHLYWSLFLWPTITILDRNSSLQMFFKVVILMILQYLQENSSAGVSFEQSCTSWALFKTVIIGLHFKPLLQQIVFPEYFSNQGTQFPKVQSGPSKTSEMERFVTKVNG